MLPLKLNTLTKISNIFLVLKLTLILLYPNIIITDTDAVAYITTSTLNPTIACNITAKKSFPSSTTNTITNTNTVSRISTHTMAYDAEFIYTNTDTIANTNVTTNIITKPIIALINCIGCCSDTFHAITSTLVRNIILQDHNNNIFMLSGTEAATRKYHHNL